MGVVLIVEDEEQVRVLVQSAIQEAGHHLEGVAAVRRQRPRCSGKEQSPQRYHWHQVRQRGYLRFMPLTFA